MPELVLTSEAVKLVLSLKLNDLKEKIENANLALSHLDEIIKDPTNNISPSSRNIDLAELSCAAIELDYALVIYGFAELCIDHTAFNLMVKRIEWAIKRANDVINMIHKDYMKR